MQAQSSILHIQLFFNEFQYPSIRQIIIRFSQQIGAKMINGNNYEALTHNGITQLFSQTFQRQQFILQIIQLFPYKETQCKVFISDGFTWIKGALNNQAKVQAQKSGLNTYSIIKFLAEDFQIVSETDFNIKINRISSINARIQTLIGEPVPYKDYNKKKDFINFQSGNVIASKQTLSIKQVKQMSAGKISAIILAKVIKKADKINKFMNIMLQDQQKQTIQCCFFGDSVNKYKDIISQDEWYKFQDPMLQINNRYGNMLQLKINEYSSVSKAKKQSNIKPGIINHNNNINPSKIESSKGSKESLTLKEFIMKNYQAKQTVDQYDLYVIARPLKMQVIKNFGRNFECVTRLGQLVQIVLWNDCNAQINLNQTYRFDNMKLKKRMRQKISLQSQKNQTRVQESSLKIYAKGQNDKTVIKNSKLPVKSDNATRLRYLSSSMIVYSIKQMLQKCEPSKERSIFLHSSGFITIRFDGPSSNSSNGVYDDLRKKLFFVLCEKCDGNDYMRSKTQLQSMNGKVVCSGCKSQTVKVIWNIKAIFMDYQIQIPCKINSETAEKLIQMAPFEAIMLYIQNPNKLKKIVERKLNFRRGVYKFSSKINDKKQNQRFYNICEIYEGGETAFYDRAVNELKQVETIFQRMKTWPNKQGQIEIQVNPQIHQQNRQIQEQKDE